MATHHVGASTWQPPVNVVTGEAVVGGAKVVVGAPVVPVR